MQRKLPRAATMSSAKIQNCVIHRGSMLTRIAIVCFTFWVRKRQLIQFALRGSLQTIRWSSIAPQSPSSESWRWVLGTVSTIKLFVLERSKGIKRLLVCMEPKPLVFSSVINLLVVSRLKLGQEDKLLHPDGRRGPKAVSVLSDMQRTRSFWKARRFAKQVSGLINPSGPVQWLQFLSRCPFSIQFRFRLKEETYIVTWWLALHFEGRLLCGFMSLVAIGQTRLRPTWRVAAKFSMRRNSSPCRDLSNYMQLLFYVVFSWKKMEKETNDPNRKKHALLRHEEWHTHQAWRA